VLKLGRENLIKNFDEKWMMCEKLCYTHEPRKVSHGNEELVASQTF
jgi:hypothetical protein